MPNTYKNFGQADLGTTIETVYTAPAATKAIVRDIHIANKTTSAATFTLQVTDSDAASVPARVLYKDISVPAKTTFIVPFVILEAGDYLQISTGTADAFDVFGSALQIT